MSLKQASLPLHVGQSDVHVVLLLSHLLDFGEHFVQILRADLEILSSYCGYLNGTRLHTLYYAQCLARSFLQEQCSDTAVRQTAALGAVCSLKIAKVSMEV